MPPMRDGLMSRLVTGAAALKQPPAWLYAVAARAGDVSASVAEPQTLALALLALGATVVVRRRRRG